MRTDPGCRSLPIAQWPRIDREAWTTGLRDGGLFDAVGAGALWSAASCRNTASGYGRWLAWLETVGECDHADCPGHRVTPERVAAYVRHLRETSSDSSLLNRLQALSDALRVLAPGEDRPWLLELCRAARRRARSVRDKRARLRPAGDLLALGERLMSDAETAVDLLPRRRAAQYRDGLMIALLIYRPVRKKNFTAMRLGTHVVEQQGRHWLRFSAAETKNRVAYEADFPEALEARLLRYVGHHRPILLAGEGSVPRSNISEIDALWVSKAGIPMSLGTLANRIEERTRAAFGQSIPPHWFRDVAATAIAIDDPVHVRDSQHVLSHANMTTTEQHYIQARSCQASRRHHAMLADLLQKGRRSSGT